MLNTAETIKYSEIVYRALSGEEILVITPYDISSSGSYVEGVFAVSRKKLCVVENGELILVENISFLEKVCCAEFPCGGILEAFKDTYRQRIVSFSMKYIEQFTAVCELINDLIQGTEPLVEEKIFTKEALCPKCGKPFIRDTSVCANCTSKIGIFRRLWNLAKPCRRLYLLLLALFWVSSIVTIVSPALSKHLINDVLNLENASVNTLLIIVGLMLLCSVVTLIVSAVRSFVSSKASNLLVRDLRNHIYEKLQKMSLGYIETKRTGDLMQRINNDTQRIQIFIQDIAIMAVNETCLFIAIAAVTFYLDPVMSLLIFVPMPVAAYLVGKIRRSIQQRYMKQWRKLDKLANRLNDVINGIKVVKVFGREDDEIARFNATAESVRDITCKNEKYVYTVFPLIRFLMSFGSYFVLLYGGSRVLGGNMSVGELVQFSSYGSYLYSKLEWFSMLPRHFTMAIVSSQRVFEVLDETDQEEGTETIDKNNLRGEFNIENVSFGYKSYRKVLHQINETVKEGEMIGLVGHSGSGKSTMINLIMRLYEPDRGRILLDGKDIENYDSHSYKELLGIVLQENYLFSGTIIDNIRYTMPDATFEDCILAAKKANAHDFIMELPDGYNTYVGEKGYKLSGGERQRISIARAILANPKILILDEATASVDAETELKIQDALLKIIKGKTVFAIAHRLSTLKNADRLFVLEEGRIAETGTHQELIEKNGIYASLLRVQQEMAVSGATIDGTHLKESIKIEDESEEFDDEQN